jgi:flagellar biosynthesis/type III secretory pathway chaperone
MSPQGQAIATQLRDHLEQEIAVHRRLLILAEDKQRHIVAHEIPAFTTVISQEQTAITDAGRLRQVRDRLLRAVATVLGIKPEALTLSAIIEKTEGSLRSELSERQRELRTMLERLRQLNERNLLLVRSGLGLVRDILIAVVGGGDGQGYDRRGNHGAVGNGSGQLLNLAG